MATPTIPVEAPPGPSERGRALDLAEWREELRTRRAALREAFYADPDTARLLRDHASLVDRIIRGVFAQCAMPEPVSVLAVGG